MGLFNIFNKSENISSLVSSPYADDSINLIYNLLFCDNIELFKQDKETSKVYPWNILFSETATHSDFDTIINDASLESRIRILAYNRQITLGHKPEKNEILGVIVEVSLEHGLDVLAVYKDGTARYINHSEKILIWETPDETSIDLTSELFIKSQNIIKDIDTWNKQRKSAPTRGYLKITFLVSEGLFFGEGPADILFNDPLAGPALTSATKLMQYLVERSLKI